MTTKNKIGLLVAVLLMIVGTLPAFSQATPDVPHTKAWYSAFSYTWTDANGASHTSSYTDPATDPYQIYDFVKHLYSNPDIPGLQYSQFFPNQGTNPKTQSPARAIDYRLPFNSSNTDAGWGVGDVPEPKSNGYTTLIVKVKKLVGCNQYYSGATAKNSIINVITNNIDEVQLLTDGLRVDEGGDRAGTVFTYSGDLNLFYFMSKGKNSAVAKYSVRTSVHWVYAPFYTMFEEYSPTTKDTGSDITDFYSQMVQGEVYSVVHDCASAIQQKHPFSMAGQNATETKALNNLVFYIPDNRAVPANIIDGRNYEPEYAPQVGLYMVELEASAMPSDTTEHEYDVTINWKSSLDKITGTHVPVTYELWAYWTDPVTGEEHAEVIYTGSDTSFTYSVPQFPDGYTIDYKVKETPVGTTNADFYAWSNIDNVIIPGYYEFLMLQRNHYESDFVLDEDRNYYRNFTSPINDYGVGFTPKAIKDGSDHFVLMRESLDAAGQKWYDNADAPLVGDDVNPAPAADLYLKTMYGKVFYKVDYSDRAQYQHHLAGAQTTPVQNDATSGEDFIAYSEYHVGPYAYTDGFNRADYGMEGASNSRHSRVGVVLNPADYMDHVGDTIVGFTFATAPDDPATTEVYQFQCRYINGEYTDSLNYATQWYYNMDNSTDMHPDKGIALGNGWHEFRLSEPIVFNPGSDVDYIWIGYEFKQDFNTLAVNRDCKDHHNMVFYYPSANAEKCVFGDSTDVFGGALAIHLIFKNDTEIEVPEGYSPLQGVYGDYDAIDFTGIEFCDEPWAKITDNQHPDRYNYWLQEINNGSTGRKTNSVNFPVYKTESKIEGFYTQDEVEGDTDHHLKVNVVNADVEMSLEHESMIYFYSLDRGYNTKPTQKRIARVQNSANAVGNYMETSPELIYQGETYMTSLEQYFAPIHRWDGVDVKTGTYDNGYYMSYIPIIWSWGDGVFDNKRYDWDENGIHNSYGSPRHRTGGGKVVFGNGTEKLVRQTSNSTCWKDEDGADCSIFRVGLVDLIGTTPINTIEFEPYMYRVWVDGDYLRGYYIETLIDGEGVERQRYRGDGTKPSMVLLDELISDQTRVNCCTTSDDYSDWIVFGALAGSNPKLRARFYYKVKPNTDMKASGPDYGKALYYVVETTKTFNNVPTGISETMTGAQVVSTTYYNLQGMESSTPFNGANIVVTRYSDGSTTAAKVFK